VLTGDTMNASLSIHPQSAAPLSPRLIRLPEVKHLTGLSRTQIYRLEARGKFVKRVKLGSGPASGTAWPESAVLQWIADRIADSAQAPE